MISTTMKIRTETQHIQYLTMFVTDSHHAFSPGWLHEASGEAFGPEPEVYWTSAGAKSESSEIVVVVEQGLLALLGIKQCKCKVNLRDLPCNSALLGW